MISWGARRQIFILVSFVLFLGALISIMYFVFAPGETCFDGVFGPGELGVDCGGVCTRVCENEITDLSVQWNKILPVRSGQYDVAAFVTNPNDRFVIRELRYQFRIFDEQNILITERSGRTFIGPRDEIVIYEPKIQVGVKVPRRVAIDFESPRWERIATVPESTVFIRNQQLESSPNLLIVAEIVNTGARDQRNIEVAAVLMEADRNVFAVTRTVVDVLSSQNSQQILFGWPQSFTLRPAFIELYPHYVREGLAE